MFIMSSNIFDQFTNEADEEKNEDTASVSESKDNTDEVKPVVEAKDDSVIELSEDQKRALRSMATAVEIPYETVIGYFNAYASEPFFAKMTNIEQRFKMLRRLVENKLDKLAKLSAKEIYLVGKVINFFTKQKHTLSMGLAVFTDKKSGEPKLKTITSWEPLGEKAYQTLLPTKNGYYYSASISESENGLLRLQENSLFSSEAHPIDLDDKYDGMNDAEILADILKLEIFESIEDAGMSEVTDKGYAKAEDIKIVRCVLEKPRAVFKNNDIPELYRLQFTGTDREGEKVVVRVTASKEFKPYENTTEAFLPCFVIGTVSEYEGTKQMDAVNIVFEEY